MNPQNSPPSLTDILGVTPFLDLVPKQDLAPLASFSRIEPQVLEPKSQLPPNTEELLKAFENELQQNNEAAVGLMGRLQSKFRGFEDPDLNLLKFKRPVIAGESDRQFKLPKFSRLYDGLISDDVCVEETDLIEFGSDLNIQDFSKDRLDVLNGNETKEEVLQHMRYYKSKYEKELEDDAPIKKRLRKELSDSNRPMRRRINLDRSKLKDSRLISFYNYLDDIVSDSDDESDQEASANPLSSRHPGHVFTTPENGLTLTRVGLEEVRRHILELVESRSITDCNSEYLKVVQSLCLNTVRHFMTAGDKHQADTLRHSFKASSSLLLILNTNTQNRELHLQSYIDCVVCLLSDTLPVIVSSNTYSSLVSDVTECLDMLSTQILSSAADDQTLTQVEYTCIKTVFSEGEVSDFETIRSSAAEILSQIFKRYDTQRLFIVNEMLTNIDKLAGSKGLPRQVKLSRGSNVSFFTIFLLRLVHNYDADELKGEVKSLLALPKSVNPHSAANVKRGLILGEAFTTFEAAGSVALQLVEFFLGRMTAADAVYKTIFMGLMDDLFAMMSVPEWPAAETMASVVIRSLISKMNSQSIPPNEEPFVLEIISRFGLESLELKLKTQEPFSSRGEHTSEEADYFCELHLEVLSHLKLISSKSLDKCAAYRFQLLKTIVFFKNLYDNSIKSKDQAQLFTVITNESMQLSQYSFHVTGVLDQFLGCLQDGALRAPSSYNDMTAVKRYRQLVLETSLNVLYDDFLSLLTVCLESTKVKLASKAIRMLSPLITKNPKILLQPRINTSISKVLSQGSALSKDAVIDLLGQFMFSSKEHIVKYHVLIGNRINEDGISVRKRVMKIMTRLFDHTDNLEVLSYAASQILKCLKDEEPSLVDAARAALITIIFDSHKVAEISEMMIVLVNSGEDTCNQLMTFLRRELHDESLRKGRSARLKAILDTTFDKIADALDSSELENMERAFALIAALAECDPLLITQDQLISLQPYLVEEIFDHEVMCFSALKILKLVLPNMKALRSDYISRTNAILLKRLTKFLTNELPKAVQIIEVFSKLTNSSTLTKAAISSMKLLWPYINLADELPSKMDASKIRKVLNLLGCFGSYCDFERSKTSFQKANIGLRDSESVVSLITRYTLFFCQQDVDLTIRLTAIRNLLRLAVNHLKLFLSESVLGILDRELESPSQKPKIEIIRGLTIFLKAEDDKMGKKNRNILISSKETSNGGFGANSDNIVDGVCSSIIQRYIATVLKLCLQESFEIGEAAVAFLQLVTKLGFANPKVCISTIIALEASPNKQIKRIACELHSEIFEKHESLADRNYVKGIKMACEYSKRVEPGMHLSNSHFLRSAYRIISTAYLAKKKFMNSVVKLFNVRMAIDNLAEAVAQRDTVVFTALNILVLNFTSMEEVYLVLFHLNRFISGEAIDLAERITATIGSKDGKGMSVPNLQLLFVFLQTALALIYLKHNLAASYCIRPIMMDGFRPSKPDLELRQPPKIVNFIDFPLSDLGLETKLSNPGSFGPLFTRFIQSTRAYSV
ncbi:hypothetical protein HF325_001634 [Metschnikowia pulcherrima]|uniref:Sister chromatid cohesion protein n=1 Tax=Metschnikowia pulcherrima TaxID=27326 RepID=A0A8H7GX23_9ASCO|nr:hypothetical protein HF325_001634 [Metschnikowia pulcherrima]